MIKATLTVKIPEKHNPPEFKEGLGKGVIAVHTVEWDDNKYDSFQIAMGLNSKVQELKDDYIEVEIKEIKDEIL